MEKRHADTSHTLCDLIASLFCISCFVNSLDSFLDEALCKCSKSNEIVLYCWPEVVSSCRTLPRELLDRGAFHPQKSRTPLAKILLFSRKIHQKSV